MVAVALTPPDRKRRRAPVLHFLLAVVDHDTERFTIEGPMSDDRPWVGEIVRARRAGRHITCCVMNCSAEEAIAVWQQAYGYAIWPPGLIVAPSCEG
jgi:hypothetical protein